MREARVVCGICPLEPMMAAGLMICTYICVFELGL